MNSLSWMIYLAHFVDGARGLLQATAIIAALAFLASLITFFVTNSPPTFYSWQKEEERNEIRANFTSLKALALKLVRRLPIAFFGALALLMFVPSQATIYAIAASEMGEEVLNSETGGKAVKALDAWLDRQIGDNSEE